MRVGFTRWIPALAGMTVCLFLAMTGGGSFAYAQDDSAKNCVYRDGGYCVSYVAEQTVAELKSDYKVDTGLLRFARNDDGAGVHILNFYESLWDILVQTKIATSKEREAAFGAAEKAGGTKIGGVNLVVLAAGTLQQLVDKNILTKEKAQEILNNAKAGK